MGDVRKTADSIGVGARRAVPLPRRLVRFGGVLGIDGREAEELQLARERLALARRIRDLVREQQQVGARRAVPLPEEEAVGRFLALADARQECMDRFDQLWAAQKGTVPPAEPEGDGSEVGEQHTLQVATVAIAPMQAELSHSIETEIQAVLREAARIDTGNRQVMEQHREQLREELRRVRQGREALRSYGRQEPGGGILDEGAFIDRKK